MRKGLGLVAALFWLSFAGNCYASGGPVSATILLSVYLAPRPQSPVQAVRTATSQSCIASGERNATSRPATCQRNSTNYIWTSQDKQDATLTISPI